MILKYISTVINAANQFAQSTRAKHVGQLSDMIQGYRESDNKPSVEGWREYYNKHQGDNTIIDATEKTWKTIVQLRENLNALTKRDVHGWVDDLIINKTFSGLQIQLDILSMMSDDYRLATPEEESQGIDGYVDGVPVSIKPNSYKKTMASTIEEIPYRIIFYKQTTKGLIIT